MSHCDHGLIFHIRYVDVAVSVVLSKVTLSEYRISLLMLNNINPQVVFTLEKLLTKVLAGFFLLSEVAMSGFSHFRYLSSQQLKNCSQTTYL